VNTEAQNQKWRDNHTRRDCATDFICRPYGTRFIHDSGVLPICRPYGADGRGTNTRLFSSNVSCWTPLDVRKGIGLRFRIIFTAVFVPSSAHEPAIPYTNEWRNCPRDLRHPPAEHQGRPENAG